VTRCGTGPFAGGAAGALQRGPSAWAGVAAWAAADMAGLPGLGGGAMAADMAGLPGLGGGGMAADMAGLPGLGWGGMAADMVGLPGLGSGGMVAGPRQPGRWHTWRALAAVGWWPGLGGLGNSGTAAGLAVTVPATRSMTCAILTYCHT